MRSRPKGEHDRGHHDKPDSTGEAAGEELEMDDWAQETWSSSPVVSERRPARTFLAGGDPPTAFPRSRATAGGEVLAHLTLPRPASPSTSPSNHHTTAKPGNGGHGEPADAIAQP